MSNRTAVELRPSEVDLVNFSIRYTAAEMKGRNDRLAQSLLHVANQLSPNGSVPSIAPHSDGIVHTAALLDSPGNALHFGLLMSEFWVRKVAGAFHGPTKALVVFLPAERFEMIGRPSFD